MATPQNSSNVFADQRFPSADNMDNIDKIKRMWRAQWPEFSWVTVPGDETSRCYQMFAPDISRVGYGDPDPAKNNQCPVYSVMCPQQGHWLPLIEGTLNVEVTVTGSGGYVTENPMWIDAQITIQPKLWFSPDTMQNNSLIKKLWQLFESNLISFPSSKGNPIKLNGYGVNQQDQPVKTPWLNITNGMDPNYPVPDFARHYDADEYGNKAAAVVYLGVEIGEIVPSTNPITQVAEFENWFNGIIMDLFNLATGNLLQYQNVLSWNVWALAPEDVYTPEWEQHANYWRFSIDVNHRSPEGNGRDPQYFDGTPFSPVKAAICNKLEELKSGIANSVFGDTALGKDIVEELNIIINANCGG